MRGVWVREESLPLREGECAVSFYPQNIELRLTDEQIASLRSRENVGEKADVTFRACGLCAFMTWACTNHAGTGQTNVSLDATPCGQCAEMRSRHGELFDYMLFIMQGQRILSRMIDRAAAEEERRRRP